MNAFYDLDEARLAFDSYLVKTTQTPGEGDYLGMIQTQGMAAVQTSDPNCIRLTNVVEGTPEEVVVRIPGILCSKTLPPVERPLTGNSISHVRHLRQYVKLTGLGSVMFDDLRTQLDEVHAVFVAAADREVLYPEFKPFETYGTFDLHARYFTDRRYAPNVRHTPFPQEVDPFHILDTMRGADFIHGPDNEVQYLRKTYQDGHAPRYDKLAPAEFKEGDIVEATCSFVAYPLGREDPYKLVLVLRSLALVSSELREKSIRTRDATVGDLRIDYGGRGRKRGSQNQEGKLVLKRRYIPTGER